MLTVPNHTRECVTLIGASGGIGSALLDRLLARGAAVFCGGRDAEKLETLLAGARDRYPEARVAACVVDARQSTQVDSCFSTAAEFASSEGRTLTGAVNLAGSILLKPAHLTSDEDWVAQVKDGVIVVLTLGKWKTMFGS